MTRSPPVALVAPSASPSPLDVETWSRVSDVLDGALAISDETARQAYIETTCGGDERVRAEVESLLLVARQSDTLLPATAWLAGGPALNVARIDANAWVGRRVGVWQIDAPIAGGGMGAVFRAHRADGHFEAEAALKLIHSGQHDAARAQRFREERQLLARLDHPNIARLLDGGTTDDGAPFLVMELVEGDALDQWCDRAQPTLTERLHIFLQICEAVQYAHQHLIVHCDLKPGNVIVTPAGQIKLLDFGIARVLTAHDGETIAAGESATPSELTLAWASPEQVRFEPCTTATDVHALGALLYRLVTGVGPRETHGASPAAILHAIVANDVVPPSQRADLPDARHAAHAPRPPTDLCTRTPRWRRALRGDLDDIVACAMQRRPSDRYATVAALRDDVRRYLSAEPVAVHHGGWRYHATKFVTRHRGAVGAAALTAIALAVTTAIAVHQAKAAREAERSATFERERAAQHFARVRALANGALFDVDAALRNVPGTTAARAVLIERAAKYLDELSSEGTPELAGEAGTGWLRLAILQNETAQSVTGQSGIAQRNFERAIALLRRANDAAAAPDSVRVDLLRAQRLFAVQHATSNRIAEATPAFADAVARATGLGAEPGASVRVRMEAAAVLTARAFYLRADNAESRSRARDDAVRARTLLDSVARDALTDAERQRLDDYRIYFFGTLSAVANTNDAGVVDTKQQLAWAREGLAIAEARLKNTPDRLSFQDETATALLDVTVAADAAGDITQAVDAARRALDIRRAQRAADPSNAGRQASTFFALISLVEVLNKVGDTPALRQHLNDAEALLRTLSDDVLQKHDMVSAQIALRTVRAQRYAEDAGRAAQRGSRATACRDALREFAAIAALQPRWEAFTRQSLEPELKPVRDAMGACGRQ